MVTDIRRAYVNPDVYQRKVRYAGTSYQRKLVVVEYCLTCKQTTQEAKDFESGWIDIDPDEKCTECAWWGKAHPSLKRIHEGCDGLELTIAKKLAGHPEDSQLFADLGFNRETRQWDRDWDADTSDSGLSDDDFIV